MIFVSALDVERLGTCLAFRALRRFGISALRRALPSLLLALERRRIAHPRLRTTPIFKVALQQGFATGEMGLRVSLHASKSEPLMSVLGQ